MGRTCTRKPACSGKVAHWLIYQSQILYLFLDNMVPIGVTVRIEKLVPREDRRFHLVNWVAISRPMVEGGLRDSHLVS